MKARIAITLRAGVLDPQGQAIEHALHGLGFSGVAGVRQGKIIDVALDGAPSEAEARAQLEAMCQKLLANPVIEDYAIELG